MIQELLSPAWEQVAAQMFMWGEKPSRPHGYVASQTVLLKLSQCFDAGGFFSHLTGSFRLGSNVLWVISLLSLCWSAVRLETILFCIHLLLDSVRRGTLKSIEMPTELCIPAKPLIHSDGFGIRRETQPVPSL